MLSEEGARMRSSHGRAPTHGGCRGGTIYHRLHGELDWQTPGERFDGTPFTDRGFASVPGLGRRRRGP